MTDKGSGYCMSCVEQTACKLHFKYGHVMPVNIPLFSFKKL